MTRRSHSRYTRLGGASIISDEPISSDIDHLEATIIEALCFVLMFRSNDDPDVITFNRNVLPVYYGLLRLACEYSPKFTRQLAVHSNMTWAFEHLTFRLNQYPKVN